MLGESLFQHQEQLATKVKNFPGGSLNFERFETDDIEACVEFIQALIERSAEVNQVTIEEMRKSVQIMATGGGAHKFYDLFKDTLQVEVRREDEMECLIEGLKFITLIPGEVYYLSDEPIPSVSHPQTRKTDTNLDRPTPDPPRYGIMFEHNVTPQLPCLLVNIGSGVSIIKVDEDGNFERVSGTSLGGGTLWGLLSLLTPAKTFDGKHPSLIYLTLTNIYACRKKCLRYQNREIIRLLTCWLEIFMVRITTAWDSSQR